MNKGIIKGLLGGAAILLVGFVIGYAIGTDDIGMNLCGLLDDEDEDMFDEGEDTNNEEK